jgi:hypothetical protein
MLYYCLLPTPPPPNTLCMFVCMSACLFPPVLRIRTILTGSGSDFQKRPDQCPDPDPDLNKFSANFFPDIYLMKICSSSWTIKLNNSDSWIINGFYTYQKVKIVSFIKARIRIRNRIRSQTSWSGGSGSDQKSPDLTGLRSAILVSTPPPLHCMLVTPLPLSNTVCIIVPHPQPLEIPTLDAEPEPQGAKSF